MDFDVFRERISKIKNIDLPGDEAHFLMVPPERQQYVETERILAKRPRQAAVMALFYPKEERTHILMILRKSYSGVHSNQVAFPGGKVEKGDNDLQHTALRETEEEVGVPIDEVEVIKPLTKVYIPPSNYWVQPFVGLYENPNPFIKQDSEVEDLLEVPLENVFKDDFLIRQKLSTSYAKDIEVPAFKLNGHVVWGATAMMLNEIKVLIKQVL